MTTEEIIETSRSTLNHLKAGGKIISINQEWVETVITRLESQARLIAAKDEALREIIACDSCTSCVAAAEMVLALTVDNLPEEDSHPKPRGVLLHHGKPVQLSPSDQKLAEAIFLPDDDEEE